MHIKEEGSICFGFFGDKIYGTICMNNKLAKLLHCSPLWCKIIARTFIDFRVTSILIKEDRSMYHFSSFFHFFLSTIFSIFLNKFLFSSLKILTKCYIGALRQKAFGFSPEEPATSLSWALWAWMREHVHKWRVPDGPRNELMVILEV